jgi:hypothetical protein
MSQTATAAGDSSTASASATVQEREQELAGRLYDELTGRHTGDPLGPNAVLAPVLVNPTQPSDRDRAIWRLQLEADALGLEVHHKSGCRRSLAQRLAAIATEELHPTPAPRRRPRRAHAAAPTARRPPDRVSRSGGLDDQRSAGSGRRRHARRRRLGRGWL